MSISRFKNLIFMLLYSFINFVIGYLIAIFISHRYNYPPQDVMFLEGIIVIAIGFLSSMKNDNFSTGLQGLSQTHSHYSSANDLEDTRRIKDSVDYHKKFFKQSVVEFAFSSITLIISGIFMILFSVFFAV